MGRRPKSPNDQFAALLDETGCTHRRLAHYVVELGKARGVAGLRYDHTSVLRWLAGETPRVPVPALLAEVLSGLAGRLITAADLGMSMEGASAALGLEVAPDFAGAVTGITALWRADVERRQFLTGATFSTAAYASAGLRWLTLPPPNPLEVTRGRQIGQADVDALREIERSYRQLDNRLGGGQLRASVVQLLDVQVAPILRTAAFTGATGRQFAGVTAELASLAGWMAFDSEQHGLAQRYLIQALSLARLADDHGLSAEVLAAMSQQAVYVARPDQAVDLARVAQVAARKAALPVLLTECYVAEAHGHAARDDARACAHALHEAEKSFEQASPDTTPAWLRYFDEAYLAARMAHCFRDLGQGKHASQYARRSLVMNDAYVRGRAFNLALLATALTQQGEIEEACAVGMKAADLTANLNSARSVRYMRDLHRRLTPYSAAPSVRHLTERVASLTRARAVPR
jgi:tetratricopeptide (TPR) repeat protein